MGRIAQHKVVVLVALEAMLDLWEWAIASHGKDTHPFFGSRRTVGQLAPCFSRLYKLLPSASSILSYFRMNHTMPEPSLFMQFLYAVKDVLINY